MEKHSAYHEKMVRFLDDVYESGIQMVTSTITLTEICTVPFRLDLPAVAARYREYVTNSEHLFLRDVDVLVAEAAARLRALHKLRPPDAIQLATATIVGAGFILTNDLAWQRKSKVKVITLESAQMK